MMYSVATSYNYSTIIVGVEAENETEAEEEALKIMEQEWGTEVHNYSDLAIEEIN